MTLQIIKPYIHVEDANGNPYVGAKLYVYVPGTTTPAAIYADAALSVPLPNPLAGAAGSDAAGNFPRAYIAAGAYKLRVETAAGVLIWQEDNIDTGLPAGTGALPVSAGGTGGITATAARAALDVPSNSELAALAGDISNVQTSLANIVSVPQGYLTPTPGTPIIAAGVTAGTAAYYTPLNGNLIPIYNGSQFNTRPFSELTLILNSNHVAGGIYDVFVFEASGVVTIGSGPVWNTVAAGAGARGTGAGTTEITRAIGGLWTNAYAMTARNGAITYPVNANRGTYVGSLSIDGTNGQITCHRAYGQSRKWAIWNTHNRAAIIMKAGDSTSNWSYGTNTIRPSNNSSANSLTIFTGLAEELFDLQAIQAINAGANAGNPGRCGIGYNSTTAFSGTSFLGVGTTTNTGSIAAALGASVSRYIAPPALGINTITMLETPGEAVAKTFYGQESSMLLTAQYRG